MCEDKRIDSRRCAEKVLNAGVTGQISCHPAVFEFGYSHSVFGIAFQTWNVSFSWKGFQFPALFFVKHAGRFHGFPGMSGFKIIRGLFFSHFYIISAVTTR
jgi:hypothetical protein